MANRIEYDPSVVYAVEDLARYWRCKPETVRHLIRTGGLEAFKCGKEYRITDRAVREYEEGVRSA
jgi:excisionase family DNA binding protein